MTKIYYDDSKIRQIGSDLEETSRKVNLALNHGRAIRTPYGFSRGNDIQTCLSTLTKVSGTLTSVQNWVTKTNNAFSKQNEDAKNRVQRIENVKIVKQDLLVK